MGHLLREREAADYVGINRYTFRGMRRRTTKYGQKWIPHYRMGVTIYYDSKDLDAWKESCKRQNED